MGSEKRSRIARRIFREQARKGAEKIGGSVFAKAGCPPGDARNAQRFYERRAKVIQGHVGGYWGWVREPFKDWRPEQVRVVTARHAAIVARDIQALKQQARRSGRGK